MKSVFLRPLLDDDEGEICRLILLIYGYVHVSGVWGGGGGKGGGGGGGGGGGAGGRAVGFVLYIRQRASNAFLILLPHRGRPRINLCLSQTWKRYSGVAEKFGNRDYILTIDYATMDDDAEYMVVARNVAGQVRSTAQVIVEPYTGMWQSHVTRPRRVRYKYQSLEFIAETRILAEMKIENRENK